MCVCIHSLLTWGYIFIYFKERKRERHRDTEREREIHPLFASRPGSEASCTYFYSKKAITISYSKLYATLLWQSIQNLVEIIILGISYSHIFAMPGKSLASCSTEPEMRHHSLLIWCWLHKCQVVTWIATPGLRGLSLKAQPCNITQKTGLWQVEFHLLLWDSKV